MKVYKIALLIIAAVFLFSSLGFCNEEDTSKDGGHCCVACCSAGCHASVVQNNQFTILYSPSASFIPIDATLRQELFIGGIEYPPKSLI
jgi:hypothetical protein